MQFLYGPGFIPQLPAVGNSLHVNSPLLCIPDISRAERKKISLHVIKFHKKNFQTSHIQP